MEPLTADDPRQVGSFRLQSRLGAGGMGRVYLASSPGGRAVAVKVVHPELAHDPEFMRRFRREVAAAEAVSGAYTAPVVGAGPDDSPPWLATAYVPGPSLAELVTGAGPLPEAAVWRLAGGLIEALQAIHARGLVHRDLKPGNILIAADGPRVIDFGISRALQGTALTATRMTMGTPSYMSPEQAEGTEAGPPSDVFSLGSVLAYAATGSAPFEGGDTLSVIYRIVHAEPDISRLPPALARLVAGCLVKDPAGRPSLDALLGAVTASSAVFPENTPGKFWPDSMTGLVTGLAAGAAAGTAAGTAGGGQARAGFLAGAGNQGQVPSGVRSAPVYPATETAARSGGTTHPASAAPPVPPRAADRGTPGTAPQRPSRRWLLVTAAAVAAAAVGATLALTLGSGPTGSSGATGTTGAGGTTRTAGGTSASHSGAASVTATSQPATSPATSPTSSATTSLIAVTVCTFPADGCNQPGAAQYMEVRPDQITDSGDGSGYVKDLVWTNWGGSQATATGTEEVDNCNPSCAQGTFTGYPATVTLAGLTPYGTGLEAYSTIVIQSPAANLTETYTTDTVP
jgi:Protein kinase domain